jgi:hypothetical protein
MGLHVGLCQSLRCSKSDQGCPSLELLPIQRDLGLRRLVCEGEENAG